MDKDKKLRKVIQHVWDFISFKVVLTSERPVVKGASGINPDMIKLLRMVVWTGTYVSLCEWRGFVYEHYIRMTSSPKLYATYVLYACYTTKHFSHVLDAYQTFLRTLSLVVQLALYSSNDRQEELLGYSKEIFLEFFEKELKKDFKKQGGWKNFGKYLQENNPQELFKILEKLEGEGQSPGQIIRILGMFPTQSDPLREYINHGIKEEEVEINGPTVLILKCLGYFQEATLDESRANGLRDTKRKERQGNTDIKTNSKKFGNKLSEQDSKVAMATGGGKSKGSLKQTKQTVRPAKRITTRQTYLRAKEIIQDLRLDFQILEELLEFVFGETKTAEC